jgi:hypothetical protein
VSGLVSGGEVPPSLDITAGGLVVTPIANDRRTEAVRKMVGIMPEAGKNTLSVTHKPNIIDALGKRGGSCLSVSACARWVPRPATPLLLPAMHRQA